MTVDYNQLIKDITKIDLDDICSDWQWLLNNEYSPIMVSLSGDTFLADKNAAIFWLDTGKGQLKQIADNIEEFKSALEDIDNVDEWLLASTVLDLIAAGITLKEREVYSYRKMPILSGDYSLENFEPTDISVHFSITGQICRQLRNLPKGTRINKISFNPSTKNI
ncbi:MAG: T6SS immunity protein Tdi1 domain-containing protein [Bacteroidota bacterium]